MNKITVFYDDNKNPSLEEMIKETALRYKANVGDFSYSQGSFESILEFNNQGQINNFKNDLIIIERAFNIKIKVGGIYSI